MANPYQEMELRTASPVKLVVRMYEGALKNLRAAQIHHGSGDVGARGQALAKALAILGELRSSLDLEVGGEIATNLDSLYAFSMDRLVQANLNADPRGIGEVIPILESLQGAWAEVAVRPPPEGSP